MEEVVIAVVVFGFIFITLNIFGFWKAIRRPSKIRKSMGAEYRVKEVEGLGFIPQVKQDGRWWGLLIDSDYPVFDPKRQIAFCIKPTEAIAIAVIDSEEARLARAKALYSIVE